MCACARHHRDSKPTKKYATTNPLHPFGDTIEEHFDIERL